MINLLKTLIILNRLNYSLLFITNMQTKYIHVHWQKCVGIMIIINLHKIVDLDLSVIMY